MREARNALGLSQAAIADLMVHEGHRTWRQSTVAKSEAGERPLRLDEFMTLCVGLEVDPVGAIVELDDEYRRAAQEIRSAEFRVKALHQMIGGAKESLASKEAELREAESHLASLQKPSTRKKA